MVLTLPGHARTPGRTGGPRRWAHHMTGTPPRGAPQSAQNRSPSPRDAPQRGHITTKPLYPRHAHPATSLPSDADLPAAPDLRSPDLRCESLLGFGYPASKNVAYDGRCAGRRYRPLTRAPSLPGQLRLPQALFPRCVRTWPTIGRAGLLATSAIIRAPRLPARPLAPTSATLRASSIAVTASALVSS
jgi:hypothetical protein